MQLLQACVYLLKQKYFPLTNLSSYGVNRTREYDFWWGSLVEGFFKNTSWVYWLISSKEMDYEQGRVSFILRSYYNNFSYNFFLKKVQLIDFFPW